MKLKNLNTVSKTQDIIQAYHISPCCKVLMRKGIPKKEVLICSKCGLGFWKISSMYNS